MCCILQRVSSLALLPSPLTPVFLECGRACQCARPRQAHCFRRQGSWTSDDRGGGHAECVAFGSDPSLSSGRKTGVRRTCRKRPFPRHGSETVIGSLSGRGLGAKGLFPTRPSLSALLRGAIDRPAGRAPASLRLSFPRRKGATVSAGVNSV